MSLSIGDANDIQELARFFAHLASWEFTVPTCDPWRPDERSAAQALERLTSRSYARLGAGMSGPMLTGSAAVSFMLEQVDDGHRAAQ